MKTVLLSILAALLMVCVAAAQGTATPASTQPQTPPTQPMAVPLAQAPSTQSTQTASANAPARMAPGSVIPVSLTKTIDAKKAKAGDEVVATVTQDMKSNSGEVLVPKDTKVIGHVTEAQAHSKEQKESQLGIAFDRAVMKNGSEMQMPMSIQAIIGEQNDQNNAGGGNNEAAAPSRGSGPAPGSGSRSGMAGSAPAPAPSASANDTPGAAQTGKSSRPAITAKTEGVVGISNLTLSPLATNSPQGSVVSSDKNNVKLESGTMMLLRVNQ